MAYYAKISNQEFTRSERARLEEARHEKSVIENNNRASEEYATLKTAYQNSFTSATLQTLEGELAALQSQYTPGMTEDERKAFLTSITAKQAEIDAEKAALIPGQEAALASLNAKEAEGTEALTTEIETLNTAIDNALCRVTAMYTGADEFTSSHGEVTEVDNTVYWEGFYGGCKRTSYNTQGGVHKLGGTPFRKNYAGVGYIYDPVRDAFYSQQPYASWTLDESTCYWQPPTPRPEGMDWYWNEAIVEWTEYPNKPFKSWTYENKIPSWNGYYAGDETINDWFAPSECPDASDLSLEKLISSYIWDEETQNWIENGNN